MMTSNSWRKYLKFSLDHSVPYMGPFREQPEFLYGLEQVSLLL